MMKKNMLVILVVIGVIGVVAYLLKDKLRVLLGERAEREEAPGIRKIGLADPLKYPGVDTGYFGLKPRIIPGITMGVGMTLPMALGESQARWLQEEIAPILKPMYPVGYIQILRKLLISMGEGEVTRATEIISKGQEGTHPLPPTNGPYSWALPQF